MNTSSIQDSVLALLRSDPEQAWKPDAIARKLELTGKNRGRLHSALRQLTLDGDIVELRKGVFGLGHAADLVSGNLVVVRSGRGLINDRENGRTVWVQPEDMGTALPGDRVLIRLHLRPDDAREGDAVSGRIVRIVERATRDIVGTLHSTGRFFYVVPLNPVYRQDFYVPDSAGARVGDRVLVRFLHWENRHVSPEGEIIEVLGPAEDPSLDTEVVIRQFDLPGEFEPDVLGEAEQVAARLDHPGPREDLRDTLILTIDPATAKDFDDALSLTVDSRGRRVLGVHIADVSHFVLPGSALDEEAARRGTSVYLVDKVIPMLPEQLSNGVCSLRPGEDRLTFSAFLTFNAAGDVVERRFARSRIRSGLRLSYEQAMAVIEGDAPRAQVPGLTGDAVTLIRNLHALSRQLREKRFANHALDIESAECEVLIDPDGSMRGVKPVVNDASHQLIEECMVAANEAVATELLGRGIRILSRLHEPPDPEKIEELATELAHLGFQPGNLHEPRNLAAFLRSIKGHPLSFHANMLVLRSMKRAVYSAEDAGHFGLGKRFYAHFTSPIRRYPDLVLHRQLAGWLTGKAAGAKMKPELLKSIAIACTEREDLAEEASRALIEIKKFRFLEQQLAQNRPEIYDAVVAKVMNFGLFVDVLDLQMQGLVHVTTISEKFVRHNRSDNTLRVENKVFGAGTRLKVHVSRLDFNRRRADFVIDEVLDDARPTAASGTDSGSGAKRGRNPNRGRPRKRPGRASKSR